VLTIGSALYAATHFAITTDTDELLPQDLSWRQDERAYRDLFPQDQILAVVQGPTTELVEMAADRLAAELELRHDQFSSVRRPQNSEFVQRNALLFLPVDQVTDTAHRLAAAKPLIEVLAADPSLRGVMHVLTVGAGAVQARRVPPDTLAGPMNRLSDTLDDLFAGRFPSFSWRVLMNSKPAAPDELRGFIQHAGTGEGVPHLCSEMRRSGLYEATAMLLCRDARVLILKSWGLGLAKRIGMRRAKVAVARKLAVIMHRIWSDQSEYRWTAIPSTTA